MELSFYQPGTKAHFILREGDASLKSLQVSQVDNHFYTFLWNFGLSQAIVIDEVTYTFPGNAVLPVMMSQRFYCEHPESITAVQFNREFYCIVNHDAEVGCVGFLFYGLTPTLFIGLDSPLCKEIESLIQQVKAELLTDEPNKLDMLRALLVRLIIMLTRQAKRQYIPAEQTPDNWNLMRQYNLMVELHYKHQHGVQFYADNLHKSPKTIAHIFRRISTRTPQQIIHERLASEATRLLLYTEKSIKEIAHELGFADQSHFSKFYKRQTGHSPSGHKRLSFRE